MDPPPAEKPSLYEREVTCLRDLLEEMEAYALHYHTIGRPDAPPRPATAEERTLIHSALTGLLLSTPYMDKIGRYTALRRIRLTFGGKEPAAPVLAQPPAYAVNAVPPETAQLLAAVDEAPPEVTPATLADPPPDPPAPLLVSPP